MKQHVGIFILIAAALSLCIGCPPPGGGGADPFYILKTGQDADDHTAAGDDGDLQAGTAWPVPRFTNNEDGTVTDNFTGLMWEQSPSTSTISWGDALTYANDSTLAGHDDWRLPNRNELITLHYFSEYRNDTWLNGNGFSNIQFNYYWTSTTRVGDTNKANIFYVGCRNGDIGSHTKTDGASYYAIICRGSSPYVMKTGQTTKYVDGDDGDLQMGVAWPATRYTNNGDGTLTDTLTGLVWEQSPDTTQKNWAAALTYANDSTLAGYDDWRLPNYYELATMLNAGEETLSTWLNANGFSNVGTGGYWTNTYTPIVGTDYIVSFFALNSDTVATGVTDPTQTANLRSLIVRGTAE